MASEMHQSSAAELVASLGMGPEVRSLIGGAATVTRKIAAAAVAAAAQVYKSSGQAFVTAASAATHGSAIAIGASTGPAASSVTLRESHRDGCCDVADAVAVIIEEKGVGCCFYSCYSGADRAQQANDSEVFGRLSCRLAFRIENEGLAELPVAQQRGPAWAHNTIRKAAAYFFRRWQEVQLLIAKAEAAGKCTVCLSGRLEVVLLPCGHACLCQACAQQVIAGEPWCPLCRGRVEQIHRIFIVGA